MTFFLKKNYGYKIWELLSLRSHVPLKNEKFKNKFLLAHGVTMRV